MLLVSSRSPESHGKAFIFHHCSRLQLDLEKKDLQPLPSVAAAVSRGEEEDYYPNEWVGDGPIMMDECQEDVNPDEKGQASQRPLLLGTFLFGLGLSCLFLVYPSMMIAATDLSETRANHLLALICVVAAFASPILAIGVGRALTMVATLAFVAFLGAHILTSSPVCLGWAYFIAGPFLAFLQWGPFLRSKGQNVAGWLQASKGWPPLLASVMVLSLLQLSSDFQFKNSVLSFNIIVLALAGLCQLVHHVRSGSKAGVTKTDEKKPLAHLLWFFLKDNRLHLLLPMVFFTGLFEAFMARHLMAACARIHLARESGATLLAVLGASRLISTWLTNQLHLQGSPSMESVSVAVLNLFQLALLLHQWLWRPSSDDPLMFFAITFVWGTTSAAWDFWILGPVGIGRYADGTSHGGENWDWKSAVALVSLHQFAGMAISFGLQIDPKSLTAAFLLTLVPFWCYLRK